MSKSMPDLSGFHGSEHIYRHWANKNFVFTDGIKYLADAVGAWWLIDEIAFAQSKLASPEIVDFQLWKLEVADNEARLTCQSDSNTPFVFNKKIDYTDFPESIKLYYENNTLMLPSER